MFEFVIFINKEYKWANIHILSYFNLLFQVHTSWSWIEVFTSEIIWKTKDHFQWNITLMTDVGWETCVGWAVRADSWSKFCVSEVRTQMRILLRRPMRNVLLPWFWSLGLFHFCEDVTEEEFGHAWWFFISVWSFDRGGLFLNRCRDTRGSKLVGDWKWQNVNRENEYYNFKPLWYGTSFEPFFPISMDLENPASLNMEDALWNDGLKKPCSNLIGIRHGSNSSSFWILDFDSNSFQGSNDLAWCRWANQVDQSIWEYLIGSNTPKET